MPTDNMSKIDLTPDPPPDPLMAAINNLTAEVNKIGSKEDIANQITQTLAKSEDVAVAIASRITVPNPMDMAGSLADRIKQDVISDVQSRAAAFEDGLPFKQTIVGKTNQPVTANIGGTDAPIKLAPVSASLDVNAVVGGAKLPIRLDPVKIEVGQIQVTPNVSIELRLFGLLIGSIRIIGNAHIN